MVTTQATHAPPPCPPPERGRVREGVQILTAQGAFAKTS